MFRLFGFGKVIVRRINLRVNLNAQAPTSRPNYGSGWRQNYESRDTLRAGLSELDRWQDTLIMTYFDFGRRAHENQSNGTDHGTAAARFVVGGRVKGGIIGRPLALDRLDGNGNLLFDIDFLSLYATVVERWWGLPGASVFGSAIRPLEILRS